ncbi:MAG: peptidylprolyl isomerase [Chloroflexota bacterium]
MAKQSSTPKVVTKKHVARLERERQQVRLIRTIAIAGIAIVALLLVYGYLNLNVFALREPVAEVNNVKVMSGEWQERVRLERVNLYNQLSRFQFFQQSFGMDTAQQQQEILLQLGSTEILGKQVLDLMVDEVLLRQEAEKRGITVSDEEVETLLQEAYGFFPEGTPTPTITPTEFSYPTLTSQQLTLYPSTSTPTAAPTSTAEADATSTPGVSATATAAPATPTFVPQPPTASPTPYTLEGYQGQFNETLTQFKDYEISEKTLRSVYEVQILRTKLQDEMSKDLPQTEVQVLARHVLVEDEATAKTVTELLKQGVDFAKVAADFSKDTSSAARGGELGWTPVSSFVTEFADAVSTLKIGEISEPVKTEFGYHVIEVIAREELPLTASQFEQKKQTVFNEWLTSTREAAAIIINDIWQERVPTEPVLSAPQ